MSTKYQTKLTSTVEGPVVIRWLEDSATATLRRPSGPDRKVAAGAGLFLPKGWSLEWTGERLVTFEEVQA